MEAIRSRPSLALALAFGAGLFACESPWAWLAAALAALLSGGRLFVACLVAAIGGWQLGQGIPGPGLPERRYYEGWVSVETVPVPAGERQWLVARSPIGRLLVAVPAAQAVVPGDRLFGRGVVDPLNEAEDSMWRRRRVLGRWKPHGSLEWVRSGSPVCRAAVEFRERFLAFSVRTFGPGLAEAVGALCFNVRGDLSKEFQRDLRTTGTVHIVSASGLHAAVVAFAVFGACSFLPIPRWIQLAAASAVLALYAVAAGLQAPIVRSMLLVVGLKSAYLWRREPDAASLTSFTALLFLLAEPWLAWDVGFQLSFATVLGLAAFGGHTPRGETAAELMRQAAWSLVRASAVASAVSAPLVGYHFGQVPLVSVASNLLIAFAVGPVVVLSLGAALMDPFLPALSHAAAVGVIAPLGEWLVGTIDWLGAWDATAPRVPEFGTGWLVAVYAGVLLLWRERRRECDYSITK